MRGFGALEWLEQVSVGIKLSVIAGLLFALAWYFADKTAAGELVLTQPQLGGVEGLLLAFRLLVTVQGGSSEIYMVYIVLLCFVVVPVAGALMKRRLSG